ncbi:MAG: hypothetical protein K9L61_05040, partial [Candidatus Omnitrophica bacterium]|nr:hypothetical protein [Candidatus Omnitrophota bacterium]
DEVERRTGRRIAQDKLTLWAVRRLVDYKSQYPMLRFLLHILCAGRSQSFRKDELRTVWFRDIPDLASEHHRHLTEKVLDYIFEHRDQVQGLDIKVVVAGPEFMPFWVYEFKRLSELDNFKGKFNYLSNSDAYLLKMQAIGADICINMPRPLEEACGTSDQRTGLNGGVNIAIRGAGPVEWIDEYNENTGEGSGFFMDSYIKFDSRGPRADHELFYSKGPADILRACERAAAIFYDNPVQWKQLMFNSYRAANQKVTAEAMEARYAESVYSLAVNNSSSSLNNQDILLPTEISRARNFIYKFSKPLLGLAPNLKVWALTLTLVYIHFKIDPQNGYTKKTDRLHYLRVLAELKRINSLKKRKTDIASQIAALVHDIERWVPELRIKKNSDKKFDEVVRKRYLHPLRSRAIAEELIKGLNLNQAQVNKINFLIQYHDAGLKGVVWQNRKLLDEVSLGHSYRNDLESLVEADSLVFFKHTIGLFIKYQLSKNVEQDKIADRINLLYERVNSFLIKELIDSAMENKWKDNCNFPEAYSLYQKVLGNKKRKGSSSSLERIASSSILHTTSYKDEPETKHYFEKLVMLNLKLIKALSARTNIKNSIKSIEKQMNIDIGGGNKFSFQMKKETLLGQEKDISRSIALIVFELEDFIKQIEVQGRGLRQKAKDKVKRAIVLIENKNEPAANAVLVSAASLLLEELRSLVEQRIKKISPNQKRVRFQAKSGTFSVLQGKNIKYTLKEGSSTTFRVYEARDYQLLWQAFRAVDHQLVSEVDELNWLRNTYKQLFGIVKNMDNYLSVMSSSDKEKGGQPSLPEKEARDIIVILSEIRTKSGKAVLGIKTAIVYSLDLAIELIQKKQYRAARTILGVVFSLSEIRGREVRSIILKTKSGRLQELREKAKQRNDELFGRIDNIILALDKGDTGLAFAKTAGLLKLKRLEPVFKEPEFWGLRQSLGYTSKLLKSKDIDRAKERLFLAREKVIEAQNLGKFMQFFRSFYVESHLEAKGVSERESFLLSFEKFLKDAQLNKGSPQAGIWRALFCRAAFVPLYIADPGKKSKKVTNPVFLAIGDLVEIKKSSHTPYLFKKYAKKKPATHKALKTLAACGKTAYSQFSRTEKDEIIKSLALDYGISKNILSDACYGRRSSSVLRKIKVRAEDREKIAFETAGWRAEWFDFTQRRTALVSQAIAEYIIKNSNRLKAKGLARTAVVGYDMRPPLKKHAELAAKILAANRIKVLLTDRAFSTPLNVFSMYLTKSMGMLNFTASHNPLSYGGVEFFEGETLGIAHDKTSAEIMGNIAGIEEVKIETGLNSEFINYIQAPLEGYLNYLEKEVGIDFELIKNSKIKFVFDCLHGSSLIAKDLFKVLGLKPYLIHAEEKEDFSGLKNLDSSKENLEELSRTVRAKNAAVGLATDGDGDRAGVVLDDGNWLSPNEFYALMLYQIFKEKKRKNQLNIFETIIIKSIVSSHLAFKVAGYFGIPKANLIETHVGNRFINEKIGFFAEERRSVLLAFEESGGAVLEGALPYKDGIAAVFKMLEITAKTNRYRRLSDLYREMTYTVGKVHQGRRNINLKISQGEDKDKYKGKNGIVMRQIYQLAAKLKEEIKENGISHLWFRPYGVKRVKEVDTTCGVKIKLDAHNGWVAVRPSGTEPVFRIYSESEDELEKIIIEAWISKKIKQYSSSSSSSLKDIKAIIFDMDKTLYRNRGLDEAFCRVRKKFLSRRLSLPSPEADKLFRQIRDVISEEKGKKASATPVLERLGLSVEDWEEFNAARIKPADFLDKDERLKECIAELSNYFYLVVLTNNSLIQAERILKALGIDDLFNFVLARSSTK